MRVRGVNHITLGVSDLARSVAFYRDVLGCEVTATWAEGAYLAAGSLWVCLLREPDARPVAGETHLAFDVAAEDFDGFSAQVRAVAPVWKENRSEGASLYFEDPDGHRLELHVGTMASRLAHYRRVPAAGVEVHL